MTGAMWNLLEIYPLGCQGKLFTGKCLTEGNPLQNHLKKVLRKPPAMDVPGHEALQGPLAGGPVGTVGTC